MTDRTIFAANQSIDAAAKVRNMLDNWNAPGWHAGSAEPWLADLLGMLVRASGAEHVIEIGGFEGYTSAHLARACKALRWPTTLTVCEIDPVRAERVQAVLDAAVGPVNVTTRVVCDDSHRWIPTLPDASVDFAWVDGNHELAHVTRELELLIPKMRPGGLICGHDVFGVCQLWQAFARFGGFSLDLPRLGPAGGIGILQIPTAEQRALGL